MNNSQVALITGASSGIGRVTAVAFLQAGYKVVLTGRNAIRLGETVAVSGVDEVRALCHPADVTDPEAVRDLFDHAVQHFGRLDVLFNNAGISAPRVEIDELSVDAWKAVVDTNLTGPFLCAQQAFRVMKAQHPRGGRIINNGSVAAQSPRPQSTPYTATKHAITGLTKACALDGRKHDIACGQIDIGNAASAMTDRIAKGSLQPDGTVSSEPVIDATHVAAAVLHMASLPLSVSVLSMTVIATKMPFVGRG